MGGSFLQAFPPQGFCASLSVAITLNCNYELTHLPPSAEKCEGRDCVSPLGGLCSPYPTPHIPRCPQSSAPALSVVAASTIPSLHPTLLQA